MRPPRALFLVVLAGAACGGAAPATTAVIGPTLPRPERSTMTLASGPPPRAGGTIIFHSDRDGRHKLFTVNLKTHTVERLTDGNSHHDEHAAASPDGASVAFVTTRFDSRTWDIGVLDPDTRAVRRLTTHLALEAQPAWMPDGRSLLYASEQDGTQAVFRVSLEGGAITRVSPGPSRALMPAVSPDGTRVAYTMGMPEGLRIVVQDLTTGEWQAVTPAQQDAAEPAWSPDGTKLAFARLWPGGGASLAVLTLDTGALDELVVDGLFAVREPEWSPNGDWIAAAGSAAAGDEQDWDLLLLPPRSSSAAYRLTSGTGNDRAPSWLLK